MRKWIWNLHVDLAWFSTIFWEYLWEYLEGRYITPSLSLKIPCVIVPFAQRSTFSASFGSFESYMVRCITASLFFSMVWIDVIELTKLKSKEVDLPFLFKDTLSDYRWIEYWLRHALALPFVSIQCITVLAWCAIWSWTCIQAYRRGGQAELR